MHSTLLAVHVTLALALTVLLGTQSTELARLGRERSDYAAGSGIRAALVSIVPITVAVVITGGLLLRDDDVQGGPWIGAGVVSAVVIAASGAWTRRLIVRPGDAAPRSVRAVLVGAPAFVLAAAFLMAARPGNAVAALVPVVLALAITAVAFTRPQLAAATR